MSAARFESTEHGTGYAPAPGRDAGRYSEKGKLDQIQPLLPVLILHLDMMDLPPRLLLPLLLKGMNSPDLGEVMALDL